ncbi:MAG: thioredoxin-like domain-containing protein [Dysgonamonadaceae bacterium]|nr:thioredoxin-like domain-containing protein [Dysgonamonadaceae bacterium]
MTIEIDNKILQNQESQEYIKFSDTEIGKTNWLMNKFNAELPNENYIYNHANEAEKNLSPEEYADFIKKREQEYYAFLDKLKKENKTTKLFDKWVNDKLKYESWRDLLRYRWTHPHYNGMQRDSFNLGESFFTFLRDYNMNDNELFSVVHTDFLDEYSIYSNEYPKDSVSKFVSTFQSEGAEKALPILKNMIDINTSGFTKELLLTKLYMNLLNAQEIGMFEAIYDSSFTHKSYFLNTIKKEYSKLRDYFSNQNMENANLSTIKSSVVSSLIDTIAQKYRDKIIYIDFWAPWCGPCIEEIPYSKDIQEYFKNDDVVFLFLANRCKEESWKSTISNKKLIGEHILLTDDQFNILAGLLNISGIPHYTLIDDKGNIVLKDAPRPSDKEKLIAEIERHLNKHQIP